MEVPEKEEPLKEVPEGNPEEVKETPETAETEKKTRFDGLSSDELLKIAKDQDSYIGERNQEIGDLKSRMDGFETSQEKQRQNFGDYGQPQQEPPPITPTPAETTPSFNWDNPLTTVNELVDKKLAVKEDQVLKAQFNSNLHRAQTAFERGKSVMKKHPNVFKGIEKDVEEQIGKFYYPYLQQGTPVDQYISDEDTWIKTAQHLRLDRGEYDKLKPDTSSAVKPTITETPYQTTEQTSSSPVLELEPADRAFAKAMGLTEKQAKENIENELKQRGNG